MTAVLTLDMKAQATTWQGIRRAFTGTQWAAVSRIVAGKGRPVPIDDIIINRWDDDEPGDPAGAVRAAIHRAKVKLGPGVIGADYGLGYRCIPPVEIVRSDRTLCPCCGQPWPEDGR